MMNNPLTAHKNLHRATEEWLPSFLFRIILLIIQEPDSGKGMRHLHGQVFFVLNVNCGGKQSE